MGRHLLVLPASHSLFCPVFHHFHLQNARSTQPSQRKSNQTRRNLLCTHQTQATTTPLRRRLALPKNLRQFPIKNPAKRKLFASDGKNARHTPSNRQHWPGKRRRRPRKSRVSPGLKPNSTSCPTGKRANYRQSTETRTESKLNPTEVVTSLTNLTRNITTTKRTTIRTSWEPRPPATRLPAKMPSEITRKSSKKCPIGRAKCQVDPCRLEQ